MEFIVSFITCNIIPICSYYLFFLLLGLITFLCSLVLYFDEPIYGVLTLILIFLFTAFTLLLLNVEFLAYTYVIVYVGAVVLLFVFVVFMLGPVYTKAYRIESFFFFKVFSVKFIFLFSSAVWDFIFFQGYDAYLSKPVVLSKAVYTNDIFIFSNLLYTEHFFLIEVAALILLVAMVAPIVFHFNSKLT